MGFVFVPFVKKWDRDGRQFLVNKIRELQQQLNDGAQYKSRRPSALRSLVAFELKGLTMLAELMLHPHRPLRELAYTEYKSTRRDSSVTKHMAPVADEVFGPRPRAKFMEGLWLLSANMEKNADGGRAAASKVAFGLAASQLQLQTLADNRFRVGGRKLTKAEKAELDRGSKRGGRSRAGTLGINWSDLKEAELERFVREMQADLRRRKKARAKDKAEEKRLGELEKKADEKK
jgi:hypothetical protein